MKVVYPLSALDVVQVTNFLIMLMLALQLVETFFEFKFPNSVLTSRHVSKPESTLAMIGIVLQLLLTAVAQLTLLVKSHISIFLAKLALEVAQLSCIIQPIIDISLAVLLSIYFNGYNFRLFRRVLVCTFVRIFILCITALAKPSYRKCESIYNALHNSRTSVPLLLFHNRIGVTTD